MNRMTAVFVAGLVLFGNRSTWAQHPMHQDTTTHARKAHPDTGMMMMLNPLGVPMERMGSGTTWIPDAVPLPARHHMAGPWLIMLHGFVFAQYDTQGGPRGDEQFGRSTGPWSWRVETGWVGGCREERC